MSEKKHKMQLGSIEELFTTQEQRDDESKEKIVEINLDKIDSFKDHPFKVLENEEMEKMVDSVSEKGVIVPVLVRPKSDGRYEMISGHRRKRASELANIETIPCIVRELSDDEAVIAMVDSNIQREEILPSEKAFAYKMKLKALNHQGRRTDLTSDQLGPKLKRGNEILSNEVSDSITQIKRYIRLTELIPELLDMVDDGKIAFNPAVEISYLTEDEQYILLDCIEYNDATPSLSQAIQLKKLSRVGNLNEDKIDDVMSQEKPNQVPKIKFNEERIRSVLPSKIQRENIEDFVIEAIEFYNKHLKQKELSKNMGVR